MNIAQTVRVGGLAAITGSTVEIIGNRSKLGHLPFVDPPKARTAQRRFHAGQALALVVQESLMAQGLTASAAAETIRAQANVLELFLAEIEGGNTVTPRFVVALREGQFDSWNGPRWIDTVPLSYGTAEEVSDLFAGAMTQAGKVYARENGRTVRNISGPWVAVQSIPVAWDILADRAAAAGYRIRGRSIIPSRAPSEADE